MNQDSIIKEALALPADERAAVVSTLLESLEASRAEEIDRDCVAEFERRLAAYKRGEMKAYSLDETVQILKERRAG